MQADTYIALKILKTKKQKKSNKKKVTKKKVKKKLANQLVKAFNKIHLMVYQKFVKKNNFK